MTLIVLSCHKIKKEETANKLEELKNSKLKAAQTRRVREW